MQRTSLLSVVMVVVLVVLCGALNGPKEEEDGVMGRGRSGGSAVLCRLICLSIYVRAVIAS